MAMFEDRVLSGMREAGGADYWVAFGAAMVALFIARHLHMKASSKD